MSPSQQDIGGNHNGGTTSYENHTSHAGPYPGDETPTNATGSEMLLRWIQFGVFRQVVARAAVTAAAARN